MAESSVRKDIHKAIDYNWKSTGDAKETPEHQKMMHGDYKPDSFDTALQYVAPVVGGIAGAGLLGRSASRGRAASLKEMEAKMSPAEWRKFKAAYDKSGGGDFVTGLSGGVGWLAGAGAGGMAAGIASRERHRPRK